METKRDNVPAIQIRADGRKPLDFRPTNFKWNVMSKADGSCYYEQGNAKVLCSVYGPLQRFRMRKLDDAAVLRCHLYTSRLSGQDRRKMRSRADKETHSVLEQALSSVILLDQYPRTRIDIVFRIIQADGNNVALCLNAANFALMDAGIYTKGLLTVAACSYGNDQIMVDVSDLDQQESNGVVLVGSINGKNEVAFIDVRGCFPRLIFKQIVEHCLAANAKLDGHFAKKSIESLKKIYIPEEKNEAPEIEALTIHDTFEVTEIQKKTFKEYDEAFEQSILSDSEDGQMES